MSDAQAEKNSALAEALGYRVEHTADFEGASIWTLYNPQGEAVPVEFYNDYWHTEVYTSPESAWELAPDFYGSVDACLAVLPEDVSVDIQAIERRGDMVVFYRAWLKSQHDEDEDFGEGATRAEALATAVLAWALAQNGGQHG